MEALNGPGIATPAGTGSDFTISTPSNFSATNPVQGIADSP
jgi:hypothetical protein